MASKNSARRTGWRVGAEIFHSLIGCRARAERTYFVHRTPHAPTGCGTKWDRPAAGRDLGGRGRSLSDLLV